MSVIKNLVVRAGADFSELQQELQNAQRSLKKAGKELSRTGRNMTRNITAPLAGIGLAAVKVGADFEAGMSEVQAISGATGSELENLTEKAKEMGKTTKFSATESAEAFKYMAMAGWDAGQMASGIEGVMSLAAASGEELGIVSDIVTDSLTAFGLQASDSSHFADVLASAASSANVSVSTLGETFKYAAPVAGSLGFSMEDVAAASSVMGNAGIKASQAGTILRTMMNNLSKGDANVALKELGVESVNADGSMRDLSDIIEDMSRELQKLPASEAAQLIQEGFGKNAMSGVLALLNDTTGSMQSLSSQFQNADGTAKDMASTMQDNLQGRLTMLKSQLEGVGIQLAEVLIPMIEKVVEKVSKWVDWFSNLSEGTQRVIVKVALVVAAIGPLLMIIGSLFGAMAKILTIGKTMTTVITGVKAAFTVLTGPIGLTVAAIAAAIAIGVLLYKNWDVIKEKAQALWNWIKEKFEMVKNAIVNPIKTATDFISNFSLFDAGKKMIGSLVDGIKNAGSKVKEAAKGVAGKIRNFFPFSPAKEGPLKDLNKMDFGTTISDSLQKSAKDVKGSSFNLASTIFEKLDLDTKLEHFGTIKIEGANNDNDFKSIVDVVIEQLRKEVRSYA